MSIWVPGFPRDESVRGAGGGSYTGGPGKFLWHTTEGGWDGSMSVFRSRLTAPHVMADPKARRKVQFIPLDRSGYALANVSGGVQTNTDSVLQVEIVGFAGQAHLFTDAELEWLGAEVLRPMVDAAPFPINISTFPTFYGEDAGFTLASPSARQRMSPAQWDGFNGQCGHQHAPENSHWDPGKLNVAKITAAAEGDEFVGAQADRIEGKVDRIDEKVPGLKQQARDRAKATSAYRLIRSTSDLVVEIAEAVNADKRIDKATLAVVKGNRDKLALLLDAEDDDGTPVEDDEP
jgi:hypothetical protein